MARGRKVIIAPSLLSGDFSMLRAECERMLQAGADWLHLDIMDGHFVPDLTVGPKMVSDLRRHLPAHVFLDCHLMVERPELWADRFARAGASSVTVHIESVSDIPGFARRLKEAHPTVRLGIALKPGTTIGRLEQERERLRVPPVSDAAPPQFLIDMVLVMTVEPGRGGQPLLEGCLRKVTEVRLAFGAEANLDIQVDGGLGPENVAKAVSAGANVIVAGTAIFSAADPAKAISDLREA